MVHLRSTNKDFLYVSVSSVNSPLYSIANFLHNILINNLPRARSHIENSFHFSISNKKLNNSFILMSLDVVSLFTNVLIELALQGIHNRWSYIKKSTDIPKDSFLDLIKFVLTSTYFTFDNVIHKQTFR